MDQHEFLFRYEKYGSAAELSDQQGSLMRAAESASAHAYAPYSGFRVGAAVLLEDKTVITGNNQENAAYPSGLCAERVALFFACAQNPGKNIVAIAIFANRKSLEDQGPVTPCGACRQTLIEYESLQNSPVSILTSTTDGPVYRFGSAADLLPFAFTRNDLIPVQAEQPALSKR